MTPDPLDRNLAAYARQPGPPGPERLTADVWREIERRRKRGFWSGVLPTLNWSEFLREPRLVIPALAFAIAAGVLPGALARSAPRMQLARESLHFGVFSVEATGFNAAKISLVDRASIKP